MAQLPPTRTAAAHHHPDTHPTRDASNRLTPPASPTSPTNVQTIPGATRSSALDAGNTQDHCRHVRRHAAALLRFIDDDLLPTLARDLGLTTYERQSDLPRFPRTATTWEDIRTYAQHLYAAIDAFQKAELQPGGTLDELARS